MKLAQAPELRDPARLLSWLATTARRDTWRWVRSRSHEVPATLPDPPERAPTPEGAALLAERDRVLWQTVERLPERRRELMHLLAAHPPPSHPEIAAELGIALGSVGPLRRRTLNQLRRMLEVQGYDHA
ncbi:RNA polymerase sigma factor (sigma-70 family) [Amycolatopsis bartoniae]|nr:RNA polymerase sigma factor (sigma-70 family) [Amycolatopsis bartoniae]